jgi:hypothetical protein
VKRILSARGMPLTLSVLVLVLIIHSPIVRVGASNTRSGVDGHKRFPGRNWVQATSPEGKGWFPNKRTIIVQTLRDVKVSAGADA